MTCRYSRLSVTSGRHNFKVAPKNNNVSVPHLCAVGIGGLKAMCLCESPSLWLGDIPAMSAFIRKKELTAAVEGPQCRWPLNSTIHMISLMLVRNWMWNCKNPQWMLMQRIHEKQKVWNALSHSSFARHHFHTTSIVLKTSSALDSWQRELGSACSVLPTWMMFEVRSLVNIQAAVLFAYWQEFSAYLDASIFRLQRQPFAWVVN